MAEYLINDTTLEDIADSIRAKDGTSASIQVSDYATRIQNIPSGSYFGSDYPILDGDSHFWVDLYFTKTVEIKVTITSEITIDWGDGTTETSTSSTLSHTYSNLGQYRIDFKGGEFKLLDNVQSGAQPISFKCEVLYAELGSNLTSTINRALFSAFYRMKSCAFNFGSGNSKYLGMETFYNCYSLEEVLLKSGTAILSTAQNNSSSVFGFCNSLKFYNTDLVLHSTPYFRECHCINEIDLRDCDTTSIGDFGIAYCYNLSKLYLPDTITSIHQRAFYTDTNLTDIYVPWAEGEVANAPWGATNATIHYEWS